MHDTESKPPMRMTPQFFAVIALTLVALIVPLAGVGYLVKEYLASRRSSSSDVAAAAAQSTALRGSLERAAQARFGATGLADQPLIELTVTSPEEAAKVVDILRDFASKAGVDILPYAPDESSQKFVAALPVNWVAELRDALAGNSYSMPEASDKPALVEIRVHTRKQR